MFGSTLFGIMLIRLAMDGLSVMLLMVTKKNEIRYNSYKLPLKRDAQTIYFMRDRGVAQVGFWEPRFMKDGEWDQHLDKVVISLLVLTYDHDATIDLPWPRVVPLGFGSTQDAQQKQKVFISELKHSICCLFWK